MTMRSTAMFGMCFFLHASAAQSQEAGAKLDVKGYAEDVLACGNEEHWDVCKQCVTQVWTRGADRRQRSSWCHETFAKWHEVGAHAVVVK